MTVSSLLARMRETLKLKTAQPQTSSNDLGKRSYLDGLRGILAISGIAIVFVQVFIPALAWKSEDAPAYQNVLSVIFSPLLWDQNFISNFYLALSCHCIALRFLSDPTPAAFAGSVVGRVVRIAASIAIACGVIFGIWSGTGAHSINYFKVVKPTHPSSRNPRKRPSGSERHLRHVLGHSRLSKSSCQFLLAWQRTSESEPDLQPILDGVLSHGNSALHSAHLAFWGSFAFWALVVLDLLMGLVQRCSFVGRRLHHEPPASVSPRPRSDSA